MAQKDQQRRPAVKLFAQTAWFEIHSCHCLIQERLVNLLHVFVHHLPKVHLRKKVMTTNNTDFDHTLRELRPPNWPGTFRWDGDDHAAVLVASSITAGSGAPITL